MNITALIARNVPAGTVLRSAGGTTVYTVVASGPSGLTVERPDTGSRATVTASKIAKTLEALRAGARIGVRKIDYTVAKEAAVVGALGDLIASNGVVYFLAEGAEARLTG